MTPPANAYCRRSLARIAAFVLFATLIVLAACGAGGGSASVPSPPPTTPPPATDVFSVKVAAKMIVFDTRRQRVYASVSSSDPTIPNTIAVIDPATASVESSVAVGPSPNQLAL